ncbi:MAG: SPOR domain-containing protein [bacterium]
MRICQNIFRFSLLLTVAGLFLLHCAARQPRDEEQPDSREAEEQFDPFAYAGDADIVTASQGESDRRHTDSSWFVIDRGDKSPYSPEVYRVQLYAGQNYYDAATERDLAVEVFDERIRINFVTPYYRVEAGDFPTLAGAEKFLERAKALGYRKSWVVQEAVDSLFWIQLAADSLLADSLAQAADSLNGVVGDKR